MNELKWTKDLAEIVEVKDKQKFGYLVSHTSGAYLARLNVLNESLCFKKKLTYVGTALLAKIKTAQTRADIYNWVEILFHKLREELEAILVTRACVSYAGSVLDAILSQHWPYEEGTGDSETEQFSRMELGESTSPPPTKTPEAKGKNIVEEPSNDVSTEEMDKIRLGNEADKIAEQKEFYEERMRAQA